MSEFTGANEFSKQILQISISPSTILENLEDVEHVLDGFAEIEKLISDNKADRINREELKTPLGITVAKLLKHMEEHRLQPLMPYDKLFGWIALEILHLGVEVNELADCLLEQATLEEVIFGNGNPKDKDNILYFITTQNYTYVLNRYKKLYKQHRFLKQKNKEKIIK